MIDYKQMHKDDVEHLKDIDRSETIEFIYQVQDGLLHETAAPHECPSWDDELTQEIQGRFVYELSNKGFAVGAYDGEILIGFGVLAHQFRGQDNDQLQVDLMFVSRAYRRQGIGTRIMNELSNEARRRGAKYLYISSTETRSAVFFYQSHGGELTTEPDKELHKKEPYDIHMLKKL